jgi:hypothetical protein
MHPASNPAIAMALINTFIVVDSCFFASDVARRIVGGRADSGQERMTHADVRVRPTVDFARPTGAGPVRVQRTTSGAGTSFTYEDVASALMKKNNDASR